MYAALLDNSAISPTCSALICRGHSWPPAYCWSTAGVLGPVLVNYFHDHQLGAGVPREAVYNQTMSPSRLAVLGFICNLLGVRSQRGFFMTDEEVAASKHVTCAGDQGRN